MHNVMNVSKVLTEGVLKKKKTWRAGETALRQTIIEIIYTRKY